MSYVGIIPAAGLATRLGPLDHAKELLSIGETRTGDGARPVPVIEASLRQLGHAGIGRCIVVTSDRKPELAAHLRGPGGLGLDIAFTTQAEPNGLAAAVAQALPLAKDDACCLLLPDTILKPYDALATLRATFERHRADLVLGVFPTARAKELGPVRFDAAMRVIEVQDKPAHTDLANSWGMAIWGARFTNLLAAAPPNANLGRLFHDAANGGLNVIACWFADGDFHDIGTPEGLTRARKTFEIGL